MTEPGHVLLYDADCGFCRWCAAKVLRWDRRRSLRPVPIQSDEADLILASMPVPERMASWHLAGPGGSVHSGGAALPRLLRLLPWGGPPARLAAAAPGVCERGYGLVAGHRSALSRLVPRRSVERADRVLVSRSGAPAGGE